MKKFKDFFDHEEEDIVKAARLLDEAERSLKTGRLSQDEFKEIAKDVLEIEQVNSLS